MPIGSGPDPGSPQQTLIAGPPQRVVGIGASAGAVEAFTRLLRALPADSGMAFVLLSHLSPTHHSELARLFTPLTRMPVQDAVDGSSLEPNNVYVLPPDRILTIEDGRLRLAARDASDVRPRAIDRFLESLAVELGPLAVGVILSGTGTDGTAGILAVKNHGGVTFAQDPALAASDGMPRSAVESGAVDSVLPLEGIAQAIANLPRPREAPVNSAVAPLGGHEADSGADPEEPGPQLSERETADLEEIIAILYTGTGVDFHHYKRASLVRRIRRRAETAGFSDLGAYLARLRQDPAEVSALFQVVLIQVTRFFREPAVFEALRSIIIPSLAPRRAGSDSVRAWVVGCATGEEAYSLAISFVEVEAALGAEIPVRVFASDVNDAALAIARLGQYPESITASVSPERLDRFFAPVNRGFQVSRRLREMCVFARHDATRDPPFPQLDLVLCSNVLIYLDPVLQRRLLQNIHYALKPGGYLVLGPAETTAGVEGLFSAFDRKHQIYVRRAGPARLQVTRDVIRARHAPETSEAAPVKSPRIHWSAAEIQRAAERAYFAQHPSASVIVNQEFEVLHYQGPTGQYLQTPTGAPTTQLLRLAHPDLQLVLGRMLRRGKKDSVPCRRQGVVIGKGKQVRRVNLSVLPVPLDDSDERYYLVVFDEAVSGGTKAEVTRAGESARLLGLEAELAESREFLQTFIDQQDAANAEVQAAFEASLSVNEEYQSTNEELESAKEELQSLNEELTTMNEQMQQRNAELQARSAEVTGLLEALDMPLLLLTRDLRLRAYNSRAAADFHLTAAKLGLALGDSTLPVPQVGLGAMVERAFRVGEVQELELQDRLGRWRALRIWPIQPAGAGGTVAIAFVDIHKLKTNIAEERDARSYSDAVVETVLDPLVVLDEAGRMLHANRAFHRTFGTDSASLEARTIGELGGEDWDPAVINEFLARTAKADRPLDGPEISLVSSRLGRRALQLGAGMIIWRGPRRILLALKDVTERKLAEEIALETSRMQAVGQLAGGVAHEINNQMTVVIGLAGFLLKDTPAGTSRNDLQHILKAADRSAAISRQLLAFSRRQMLQPVVFDLNAMVRMAETNLRPFLRPDITLEVVLGDRVGQVKADLAQLEQLLVNLAINARDAIEGPGRLRIETTTVRVTGPSSADPDTIVAPPGTYARLIVTDTGHGMDPATRARVFEPFFTTKGIGQGTGLGLASVYGVVKQSGGLIWVESEMGLGTTFTIDIPQVPSAGPPVKAAAEPSAVVGGTGTILIVDDQEAVRVWASRALIAMGYSTLVASDGREAVRVIAEGRTAVNLILSDVSMSEMDGSELRRRIAELRPELPMVFMSGFARDDLVHRGSLEAETPLLHKPFSEAALAATVREALAGAAGT